METAERTSQSCMRIAYFARHVPKPTRRGREAVALPNSIRQKRRCMSGVTAIVRTGSWHGPRVAVADQCDQIDRFAVERARHEIVFAGRTAIIGVTLHGVPRLRF